MRRKSNKMPTFFWLIFVVAIALTVLLLWQLGDRIPEEYRLVTFFLCVPVISAIGIFLMCGRKGR